MNGLDIRAEFGHFFCEQLHADIIRYEYQVRPASYGEIDSGIIVS